MDDPMDALIEHFDAHPGEGALHPAVTDDSAPACAVRLLMDYAWELKRQFFNADTKEWFSEAARGDHLLTITTVSALRRRLRGGQQSDSQALG
jgi:hypothetical protein